MIKKPFTTLDEQIQLLTDRQLVIDDVEDAKKKLLKASYYRVINGYAKYIQQNNVFIKDASFEDIFQIYLFDKKMKNVFLQYILKAECILKSYIAYVFSECHREEYAFLQPNNFAADILDISELNLKLARVIKKKGKYKNGSINHYIKKHGHVPLWVLVNHLDFGTIETFYKLMNLPEKNKVAKLFSDYFSLNYNRKIMITPEEIESFIFLIREVRNVAAHDDRLMGFKCKKNAKFSSVIHGDVFHTKPNSPRNSVFDVYMILHLFLDSGEMYRFTKIISKTILKANEQIKCINIDKILETYGIPSNYNFVRHHNRNIKKCINYNK